MGSSFIHLIRTDSNEFLREDFVLLILSTLGSTVLETLVHKEIDTLLPQSQ